MPATRSALAAQTTQNATEDGAGPPVAAKTLLDRTAFDVSLHTATLSRTLLAAGFSIRRARRQPRHIEISCERSDMLGSTIPYLLVVCEGSEPPTHDLPNIRRTAGRAGQVVVLVAQTSGPDWISWPEFLAALGGAVPTWRALGADYAAVLRTVSRTALPPGMTGEAWQIFEEAAADGLEFLFGRRVRRMGGTLLAAIPDCTELATGIAHSGEAASSPSVRAAALLS